LFKTGEAPRRVVEVGNGVVQPRLWQVRQQTLKAAEGAGCLKGVLHRFHHIAGPRVLDEPVDPPMASHRILIPGATVAGGNQCERPAMRIGQALELPR